MEKSLPRLCGNIRVTVTFESAIGKRFESFAISNIGGNPDDYEEILKAKIVTAAEAACVGLLELSGGSLAPEEEG